MGTDYQKYLVSRLCDYGPGHPKEQAFAETFLSELNHQPFDCNLFAKALCKEHPTIQQMFFKLVKACIQTRAAETHGSDLRNKESVQMCQDLTAAFDKYHFPMR